MSRTNMSFKTWCVLACLVGACAAVDEPVVPFKPSAIVRAAEDAAAAPKAGDLDVESSRVYVRVGKRRLGHEHAVEGRLKSGTLHLGRSDKAGEIVFDMTTFSADAEETRKYVGLEGVIDEDEQADVTRTMRGKGVLDAAAHPTATFTVKAAQELPEKSAEGHTQYRLDGDFTLHGTTKGVAVVAVAVESKPGKVRLKGEFSIKQSDYGIKPYSAVGGLVAVTDVLKILGDLWVVAE